MIQLPPTARLILLSLRITPNQTYESLSESTGCAHSALRESLRLLRALNLITRTEDTPARYTVTPDSEVPNVQR